MHRMLDAHSDRWSKFRDALGYADYMPAWLAEAESSPHGEGSHELWGRLHHQGDVYAVSYAALPHLVRLQSSAAEPSWSSVALIAGIEIARINGRGPAVPDDLAEAYDAALRAVPEALGKRLVRPASELLTRATLSALAAAAGHAVTADAILNLTSALAQRFLEQWRFE